jgi:uncharacterized protein YegL
VANIYDDAVTVSRRTMVLFFVLDTSGSMHGQKIGALNTAIEEVLPEINDISSKNPDAQIKIAVLQFSNGARWLTPAPMDVAGYSWRDLDADGGTDFGSACKELNAKLSRSAFMGDVAGSFAPAILLLSDGQPTDDYSKPLAELKQNNWFRAAVKVAVAIGDDADKTMLKDFTGSSEYVLTVHTPEKLIEVVKFVSVTASKIGSQSSGVGKAGADAPGSKQEEFMEQVNAAAIPEDFGDW